MSNEQIFQSKKDLVGFISDYLITHDDTIAVIKKDFKKDLINSLLVNEEFNNYNDLSDSKEEVLLLIKTGDKSDCGLNLKVCDAHNPNTKAFKMVDIDNILVVDGLLSEEESKSIIYYKEFTEMKLQGIA